VLRLSALGDVCHVLPVVRSIQDQWPGTRISWILGGLEHRLLGHIPGIEFIVFDKKAGLAGYRELRRRMAGRRFDALLHMQLALRASLAAAVVPARIKLGFDRTRAREAQWLFTTDRIEARSREHVLDSLFGFAERLGVRVDSELRISASGASEITRQEIDGVIADTRIVAMGSILSSMWCSPVKSLNCTSSRTRPAAKAPTIAARPIKSAIQLSRKQKLRL